MNLSKTMLTFVSPLLSSGTSHAVKFLFSLKDVSVGYDANNSNRSI